MQVAVQNLQGKTFIVDNVRGSSTIRAVKEKIEKQNGTPIAQVRLIHAGMQLMDDRTLADYNILPDDSDIMLPSSMMEKFSGRRPPTPPKLHMVLRLRGDGSPTRASPTQEEEQKQKQKQDMGREEGETSSGPSGSEPAAKPSSS